MSEFHSLSLNLEIYLQHRDDSLSWPLRLDVPDTMTDVGDIMSSAYVRIREILNDSTEPHVLLIDERFSHHLVFKHNIQALSIQAPDAASVTWSEND